MSLSALREFDCETYAEVEHNSLLCHHVCFLFFFSVDNFIGGGGSTVTPSGEATFSTPHFNIGEVRLQVKS